MAQSQYVKFKDPLLSWTQNINFLGILNPGRNCGFDTIDVVDTFTCDITHAATGVRVVDFNNTPITYGSWVTKQGVIIQETAPITGLIIDSNSGNNFPRYDILVGTHEYIPTEGAQTPATYSIIKGSTGLPSPGIVLPALTNPDRQVILGVFIIPAGATDLTGVRYVKMPHQDTGDERDAKLVPPNTFIGTQQWNQFDDPIVSPHILDTTRGYWLLPNQGNTFMILPPLQSGNAANPVRWPLSGLHIEDLPAQNGTRITLLINANVRINSGAFSSDDPQYAMGYRPIFLPKEYSQGVVNSNDVYQLDPYSIYQNALAIVDLELVDDLWIVKNIASPEPYHAKTNRNNNWVSPQSFGEFAPAYLYAEDASGGFLVASERSGNNLFVDWNLFFPTGQPDQFENWEIRDIRRWVRNLDATPVIESYPVGTTLTIRFTNNNNIQTMSVPPYWGGTFNPTYLSNADTTSYVSFPSPLVRPLPWDHWVVQKVTGGWKILGCLQAMLRHTDSLASTTEAWKSIVGGGGSYGPGWTTSGDYNQPVIIRKDNLGRVQLSGIVKSGGTFGSPTLTLPVGYRPNYASAPGYPVVGAPFLAFPIMAETSGVYSTAYATITPDGMMIIYNSAASTNYFLSSIQYYVS